MSVQGAGGHAGKRASTENVEDARADRKRVYLVEHTVIERYYYDPAEIKLAFGDMWDAYDGSFDDFVIAIFEEHDGSLFHGRFFYNDANPSVSCELSERWDDE